MATPDETLMKNVPMLDTDRERMRGEFENFDEMSLGEFRAASRERIDSMLDTLGAVTELAKQRKDCEHEWTTEDSQDGPYTFCVKCGMGGKD